PGQPVDRAGGEAARAGHEAGAPARLAFHCAQVRLALRRVARAHCAGGGALRPRQVVQLMSSNAIVRPKATATAITKDIERLERLLRSSKFTSTERTWVEKTLQALRQDRLSIWAAQEERARHYNDAA